MTSEQLKREKELLANSNRQPADDRELDRLQSLSHKLEEPKKPVATVSKSSAKRIVVQKKKKK